MSKSYKEKIDLFSEKCWELNNLEKAKLFEEISVAISSFVQLKNGDNDSTDGIFDILREITESLQEDFEELIWNFKRQKVFYKSTNSIYSFTKHKS